jgi:hypothetical protein
MKLNKSVKLLIGLGTIWILIYPLLFIALFFSIMPGALLSSLPEPPTSMFSIFNLIFPLHCFTFIVELILLGFYLFHDIKNTGVSDVIRAVFGVGLFFMPFIGMPVYYYLFIWRDLPPRWTLAENHKPVQLPEGNSVSNPPNQAKSSSKNLVIIGGLIGVSVLILCGFAFVINLLLTNFSRRMRDQILSIPTPVHYETIPAYPTNEKAFYQPVDTSSFIPINTFKGVYTWSDYNQVPILLDKNNVFIAGYLHEMGNSWGSGINVDIISADVTTGRVNWQAVTGSAFLLKDAHQIYAQAPEDFGTAAGIAAYDINSGKQAWETLFTDPYAAGVGHVTINDTDVQVDTYLHGTDAIYTLDKTTGKIKELVKNATLQPTDEVIEYDGIRLEKPGTGMPGVVTATHIKDGSKAWQYDTDTVISNIAVGGPTTYFLTDKNKLIAVNTTTGEVLGILEFAPRFPHDFDFVNTATLVAADGDLVAVYYEDSHQLSVFRFIGAIK